MPLQNALLDLGLEDWIPLPEAVAAPEIRAAMDATDPVEEVATALAELVRDGRATLYRGRWDSEPHELDTNEALRLLPDRRWYSVHTDDPDEERLSYVNVLNIRGDA